MLDDPSHVSQGSRWQTVGENIMADPAELSIDKALERLNVSREKQTIILKREQETAVKELLVRRDVMAILPTCKAKTEDNAPINVNPVGGGDAGRGRGFDA